MPFYCQKQNINIKFILPILLFHKDALATALADADSIKIFAPESIEWDIASAVPRAHVYSTTEAMLKQTVEDLEPGDTIVIMSNGGFEGMQKRLVSALQEN